MVPKFEKVTLKISKDSHLILNWFRINNLVANPSKFQIMFLGSNIDNNKVIFLIENKRIKSRSEVKLLSTTIDNRHSVSLHI